MRTLVIARRELGSYFRTALGWVLAALFLLLSGLVFAASSLSPGEPASMREFFTVWWSLLVIVAPAISMRLLAEEQRTGTLEPLLTSPVAEVEVVAGKLLGAAGFLACCLAPTLSYVAVLAWLAGPDLGPIVAGYVGVMLLGTLYLSVGLLFSALTASQTLAFLATMFFLLLSEVGAQRAAAHLPAPLDAAALSLSVNLRLGDFARGVVDSQHVVFFLAATAWFGGLTALVLRTRRWA